MASSLSRRFFLLLTSGSTLAARAAGMLRPASAGVRGPTREPSGDCANLFPGLPASQEGLASGTGGQQAVSPGRSGAAAATRWQRSADRKREMTRDVVWTSHEPLYFLRRRGGDQFDDEAEIYERMYDPENLKRMAAAGVRCGLLHFYKGFGLEYERSQIERTRRAADLMHQLGMKVSLYIAGTMFIETLYREVPGAEHWEQRDQDNHWVSYGMQTYRRYACPNEPAYREYLKLILRMGVEELHADEIAFDNLMLQPEPKSCRCPRCIQAFREFLQRRYPTQEAVARRFGLPDVESIQVNEWDPSQAPPSGVTVLNDPVLQEWVRFRCESLASHANVLSVYVKSLNPDVSVHMNIKGLYSFNRYWTNAVYHPLFASHVDVISFDTGGYEARLDPVTGALVSQIRSYKVARLLPSSCAESLEDELRTATHMAFNYPVPVPGYAGAPYYHGANHVFTPLLEFFREYNDRYYTSTESVADVAMLLNWPSMAYSINATWVPTTLMEQVLIQYKIPFDILFDEQLDRLGQYAAVILADQECVSRAQANALLKYVQDGGTLLLTSNTAEYNEWRQKRHSNPLLPARREGKGRIMYIPHIVPAMRRTPNPPGDELNPEPGATLVRGHAMRPSEWVLPQNHREIYQAVVEGLPEGPSVTTEAPLTTVMELVNRPKTRETIVHFINFDQNSLPPFRAGVRKQFPGPIKSVMCFSPDVDDPVGVKSQESGGQVSFVVPSTRLYSMLVIAHE
jgi:hypothetical protein